MTEKYCKTHHYVDWINTELRPNVYVTATVKQAMACHHGASSFRVVGNRDRYAQSYDQFIRRLSIQVYGKSNWRKHRKLLPNAMTIEGGAHEQYRGGRYVKKKCLLEFQSGRAGVRYHLNICLRRPDWITFDKFQKKVQIEWSLNDWAMPDILIQESTGDCVGYSFKEGPESLVSNSLSF